MVTGEVSRVTYHGSGHLYFTLKDKNSAISVVMFKGNNQKLKFQVQEGMNVIISGGISVYTPRGNYQINCSHLEPAGDGALALAFKQLKEKLEKKGYFQQEIKKPLPPFAKHIALVTSKTGAALQDMLNVSRKRWPLIKLTLFDTVVQGDSAKESIVKNIKIADKTNADIIVIARGGGSIEDLWAFNEEVVANAIYDAKTPIVSAIGHEIDFMISDFCADLRSPTPSAAMELILKDQNEMFMYIDSISNSYQTTISKIIENKTKELNHQKELFKQNSYSAKIELYRSSIKTLQLNFNDYFTLCLKRKKSQLEQIKEAYKLNNPSKKDRVGFVQISRNAKLLSLNNIKKDDIFLLQNSKTEIKAKAIEIRKID
jgi:exodeoxyribonuclease VII large subunit